MARALINVPKIARKGDLVEIRVLINHLMESGQRRDAMGAAIPRDIIHSFVCTYNDEEVLHADFFPAISANPYLAFSTIARDSGTIAFTWTDDHGTVQTERATITVA
jgi:sulfur-oxidizing protein SoxZ